jgi:aromatic-L-amino-acid decarboxylase
LKATFSLPSGWLRRLTPNQAGSASLPLPFSTVCFRHVPSKPVDLEAHNAAIINTLNASGKAFLSHTKLNDQYVIRVAIGNQATTQVHVEQLWELLREAAIG